MEYSYWPPYLNLNNWQLVNVEIKIDKILFYIIKDL